MKLIQLSFDNSLVAFILWICLFPRSLCNSIRYIIREALSNPDETHSWHSTSSGNGHEMETFRPNAFRAS